MTSNSIIFRLLLAVVLLAPLPLGSNRPWAWSIMAVVVGLLCAWWAAATALGAERVPMRMGRLWTVAAPFALTVAWILLQTASWLPFAVDHPLWAVAAGGGRMEMSSGTVSIDPGLTRTALMRLLTYAGIFWLAVQLGRERSRARQALTAFCAAAACYAVYGLTAYFTESETILGIAKWAYIGDLTSTFVNRNSYGAYAGLGVICCLALFMQALRSGRDTLESGAYQLAETVLVRAVPYLLAGIVIASALLLSHSRGAFLSTGAAFAVLVAALLAGRVVKPRVALILGGVVLGVGLTVLSVSGDVMVKRLADETSQELEAERLNVYRLTLQAIGDAPFTGHGFGTFLPAFRMYRDVSLSKPDIWDYAHNVHLELAMDLGLPAAALFYLSWIAALGTCVLGLFRRRRDQLYPAVALAAAALLGIHGLMDFSVQMPAIAASMALLLGIGYAQSFNTSPRGKSANPTAAS